MVKVVGESPDVSKRIICRNCGAMLEYTQGEVKRIDGRDYSGGADGKEYIDCPRCVQEVTIRAW